MPRKILVQRDSAGNITAYPTPAIDKLEVIDGLSMDDLLIVHDSDEDEGQLEKSITVRDLYTFIERELRRRNLLDRRPRTRTLRGARVISEAIVKRTELPGFPKWLWQADVESATSVDVPEMGVIVPGDLNIADVISAAIVNKVTIPGFAQTLDCQDIQAESEVGEGSLGDVLFYDTEIEVEIDDLKRDVNLDDVVSASKVTKIIRITEDPDYELEHDTLLEVYDYLRVQLYLGDVVSQSVVEDSQIAPDYELEHDTLLEVKTEINASDVISQSVVESVKVTVFYELEHDTLLEVSET
jgi:hypothetical protein